MGAIAAAASLPVLAASTASAGEFDSKTLPLFTEGKVYVDKYETGLYPGAKNEMPAEHLRDGLRMAALVRPRDANGNVDANGKIVALNIGHSIASQIFRAMQARLKAHADEVNPKFDLILGSYAAQQIQQIRRLDRRRGSVWDVAATRLRRAGHSFNQVQVLFLHTTANPPAPSGPLPPFPDSVQQLQRDVVKVLAHCVKIYPNLRICYVTSDVMRQYSRIEPQGWREAFAFKWLIEAQIEGEKGYEFEDKGATRRALPWMCWGPYIWDHNWTRDMFDPRDGVHPTSEACEKVVDKYWDLLKMDPVAKSWLWRPGASQAAGGRLGAPAETARRGAQVSR